MSTNQTFTQVKRRDQLVECAIDAIVELGFQRASVAEIARRAGVSKGVVTYHFPAKEELVSAVVIDVLKTMVDYLEPRLRVTEPGTYPERYPAAYITEWVGYLGAHPRPVIALVRIYNSFRDEFGQPDAALRAVLDARSTDITIMTQVLELGQARGTLGEFSAPIMAATVKAALDDLMLQFAANPSLDLDRYGTELAALFERATAATTPQISTPPKESR